MIILIPRGADLEIPGGLRDPGRRPQWRDGFLRLERFSFTFSFVLPSHYLQWLFCLNSLNEGRRTKETVKNGDKFIENLGVMDNNNSFDQIMEKNGNVYDENNGNNGNGYNSYMIGRIGGLLGKWRPTNMQLPNIAMARNGNGNNDVKVDNDENNCNNGNDNGKDINNGNCKNFAKVPKKSGKLGKQSLSVAGVVCFYVSFSSSAQSSQFSSCGFNFHCKIIFESRVKSVSFL